MARARSAMLAEAPEHTTDVLSRRISINPWTAYKPAPEVAPAREDCRVTILRFSPDVLRFRVKKPGNTNQVDPARICEMLGPHENLDFRDSPPDRFDSGVGKSYDGYRIAFIEDEGYVRFNNDGSEGAAGPADVRRFIGDIARAARTDEGIRRYAAEKGILPPG